MRKYFSSVICSKGMLCAYNNIYKKDASSKVFLIYGGSDFERAVFFNRLAENFKGFKLTAFNPFYDESIDGIYIENLNTYIISGHSKISPILVGGWEKHFYAIKGKEYPVSLRQKILNLKSAENSHYKKACEILGNASLVKERLHAEFSPYLNEDKVINYIQRFISRALKNSSNQDNGTVRLLSSPTPLGIHTHYDTVFDMCGHTVNIIDSCGFVGSVILGIIKDYAAAQKIPFIMSPSYFANNIPQTVLFPYDGIAITVSDENHILPYSEQERVTVSRFLKKDISALPKTKALLSVENKLLEDCVLHIYEGRDYRFKYNSLTADIENEDEAIENADKLTERLMI